MKPNYKIINKQVIYDGFIQLRIDHLFKDDQTSLLYHVVLAGCDAVAILVKTTNDLFLLNNEYRHPLQKAILGCPGGRLEKNETPIEAAQRELKEETGYISSQWTHLGSAYCLPAICDQKIHFVLAENAKKLTQTNQDPFENIEVIELSKSDIKQKIINNCNFDGVFLTALSFYYLLKSKD